RVRALRRRRPGAGRVPRALARAATRARAARAVLAPAPPLRARAGADALLEGLGLIVPDQLPFHAHRIPASGRRPAQGPRAGAAPRLERDRLPDARQRTLVLLPRRRL